MAWPLSAGRPARAASALVVLRDGVPLVWFDRRSHHVVAFPAASNDDGWAQALVSWVKDGRTRSVEVRKVDGEPVLPQSSTAVALRAGGFVEGYRGWVYRP